MNSPFRKIRGHMRSRLVPKQPTNSVLKEILETKQVTDGTGIFSLHSQVTEWDGALLSKVFQQVRPTTSLEVGFAYGISTLFICDALATSTQGAQHIVIDPFQSTEWKGIGLRNVKRAGYEKLVHLYEDKSEIVLPQLLSQNTILDAALIDGWHTFDHTLVDFFYINKMLRVGGIVVLDDASWPSVGRLINHILTYGCYRVFATSDHSLPLAATWSMSSTRWMAYYMRLRRSKWPSAVALKKISSDERDFTWYKAF